MDEQRFKDSQSSMTGGRGVAIDRSEVLKIAELAKLHFSEGELESFIGQFQSILDYVELLKQVNVDGIEPTSHVSLTPDFEKHIFREDEVRPSLTIEDSLANALDPGAGHFRVPKVL
jgi:aspartyl-tRNA(Asn)/glutamyl-tRNA(Gln) amidotransferase subunit C